MDQDLRVLIIGGGGREHALYEAIARSPLVRRVLCTPGNGGIPPEDRRTVKDSDFQGIVALAKEESVDLVVIGPEAPLVGGLVDLLKIQGICAFGPDARAAMLEGSKIFMKTCCSKWNVPTARYRFTNNNYAAAERMIKGTGFRVIKADGLCGGKGVTVAKTEDEALEAAHQLLVGKSQGNAGLRILIEEKLPGDECSVMAFCDGTDAILLPPARDYKRAYDGDVEPNPNTGGMGSYSPLPDVNDELLEEIKARIIMPTLRGMAQAGTSFRGLLYAGIMLTKDRPKLLEYNVRFGDPEAQVVLPLLDSDIVPYMLATCERGGLSGFGPLKVSSDVAVATVPVSGGYPGKYKTGFPITGLEEASREALIYHAGTDRTPELVTSGGRVMTCVGRGATYAEARRRSQLAAELIQFEGKRYRKKIAADL